jgi:hypothetical protein
MLVRSKLLSRREIFPREVVRWEGAPWVAWFSFLGYSWITKLRG